MYTYVAMVLYFGSLCTRFLKCVLRLSRKQGYIYVIKYCIKSTASVWQKPIYHQVTHHYSIPTSAMPSTYLVSIPSSCQCQSTSSGDSQSRICVCGCPAYSYHRSCRQIPRITKRSTVLLEWTTCLVFDTCIQSTTTVKPA